ncbi:EF-P 5-aminopentanol modification-associated protein YfmF [Isobaculum melis]|uniref:Predicted Zn-dependent peptidase n=1 Tax=Isobaculum melis TaxID=142588 RepID=A0A1H9RGA0_9LACT|nr:pitrilysin family protein [Isobaculum melis]SER71585.1 Predicted Zn-dependent peptidase [Isobaculum melis]
MNSDLKNGIHLNMIQTKKYKTVRIVLKFKTTLSAENSTKRTLISSLLETNSEKYPTQTSFRSKLADLYGASLSTGISKKGNMHILSLSMSVVNEKYLQSEAQLMEEVVQFIQEILFAPHVKNGAFDEATFLREKENLADYYLSIFDDKQAYTSLQLQELYYDGVQKIPSIGCLEELEKIDAASLYAYYQDMLQNDEMDIYVLGDIDPAKMAALFKQLPFKNRETISNPVFYNQKVSEEIVTKNEVQDITQAKFNLLYQTGLYYHQDAYFAGQIFNGLFGGFPHSKLFMNVREKASLAYYASSQLDSFRGTMVVQTGIETEKMPQVKDIIAAQLSALQAGDFSEEDFVQTKEMLKNQVLQSEDSGIAVIEKAYSHDLIKKAPLTPSEWFEGIDQVTREDVISVANQVHLQASFFLSGEEKNNG